MQRFTRNLDRLGARLGAWVNRRNVLAAGVATLGTAAAARSTSNTEIVKSIILAWRKLDVEKVLSYVADDIVWYSHAGGKPPIIGKQAMREFITTLGAGIAENTWRVFAMAEAGDTVYCEGVDDFKLKSGLRITVPYLGMMKMRGGVVVEWRDYFDGGIADKMKQGTFDFAQDPSAKLWDRPALF